MADTDPIENLPDPNKTGKGSSNPWVPILIMLIILPALSYLMMEYLFIPRLKSAMTDAGATQHTSEGGHGKEGGVIPSKQTVEFKNIVANLSGSLRTRYVKVTFEVMGSDPDFTPMLDEHRTKLVDTTLTVLSLLSVKDLEEPGVKNIVRNDLIGAFETALGRKMVEELYFSEFVVQ